LAYQATANNKGYRVNLEKPNDRDLNDLRNKGVRWVHFFLLGLAIIIIPEQIGAWWGRLAGYPNMGAILGFVAGGLSAAKLIPSYFLVNNLEWTGFVTQNALTGDMVPYGPGLHPCFFWEERSKDGNYSLDVITQQFEVAVATSTSRVIVKGEYEYAMSLRHLTTAIGIDHTTIHEGLTAFISSFLIGECSKSTNEDGSKRDAEWVRSNIAHLNEALAKEFMAREDGGDDPTSFEARFGFVTVTIVISSIAFPEAVQKTRDAVDEGRVMQQVVAAMYGMTSEELSDRVKSGAISKAEYDKMLNRAMAASDNNAKMDIHVFEGDAGAVAGTIAANLVGGKK
jgi:hypothetical protein